MLGIGNHRAGVHLRACASHRHVIFPTLFALVYEIYSVVEEAKRIKKEDDEDEDEEDDKKDKKRSDDKQD